MKNKSKILTYTCGAFIMNTFLIIENKPNPINVFISNSHDSWHIYFAYLEKKIFNQRKNYSFRAFHFKFKNWVFNKFELKVFSQIFFPMRHINLGWSFNESFGISPLTQGKKVLFYLPKCSKMCFNIIFLKFTPY